VKGAQTTQDQLEQDLLKVAKDALSRAHAPYSRFPVGAALESESGEVVAGCNLENASLSLGICAERVALFSLLSRGLRVGRRILITSLAPEPIAPCGACREALRQLAPGLEVIATAPDGVRRRWLIDELLPSALPSQGFHTFNPREVIARKREGQALSRDEIRSLVSGLQDGTTETYQMTAFMMATYFRGMTPVETQELTRAMLESGSVVDLSHLPGPKVDKHSTGGVGDKISIPLFPLCLAAGLKVPMLSGRGLGHTGGTLDKLDSIPGYQSRLPIERLVSLTEELGGFIAGQTAELVPADRLMYALRDVSATVESVPLIVGSILSKKISAGVTALALDVKFGRGAFMPTYDRAAELAQALVSVAVELGLPSVALLSRMDAPIGAAVGNALEIRESMALLRNEPVPSDLRSLTITLGGLMLVLGGQVETVAAGIDKMEACLANGAALEWAERWIRTQGGDPRVVSSAEWPSVSQHERVVTAAEAGYVSEIDPLQAGRVVTLLGGGRLRAQDPIDPRVGLWFHVGRGERVAAGQPLFSIYLPAGASRDDPVPGEEALLAIGDTCPPSSPLMPALVTPRGITPDFAEADLSDLMDSASR